MTGSTALERCRAQGRWPANYDRYWSIATERYGRQAMIEVLLLGRTHGLVRVRQAVEKALAMGRVESERGPLFAQRGLPAGDA